MTTDSNIAHTREARRPVARLIYALALAAVTFLSFAGEARACTCNEYGLPPCAAYWRADAVFVGTVLEITPPSETPAGSPPQATLRFAVEQAYKAVKGPEVEVSALSGTSCDSEFRAGERYLVYAHRIAPGGKLEIWPCDRTAPISDAADDLAYIQSLSKGTPRQSIIGRVSEGKYNPLKGVRVTVEGGGNKYAAVTDDEGDFKVNVAAGGTYKVRASVPFSAATLSYDGGVKAQTAEAQSVLEYEVNLPKGQCDYREVDVFKVDLKATAEISGTITDADGKPVNKLTVYLYPATPGQDFSGGEYEFAETDAAGRYTFAGLREGIFLLGVNLGRTPDVDEPYPQTFYPGVQDRAQAIVIALEQGQKLLKKNFKLPPRLAEREVTGTMVWPDGSPVTKMSPDSHPDVGPIFSIRDPRHRFLSMSLSRSDGTSAKKTDRGGNFSFVGLEGYTYVIHVHAFDADDKVMHAKHVKVTVGGEVKPIRLVLSLPGYGEDEEEIKQELSEQP